ncbi:MAG: FlaD/FlaE family flagellar protein [Candidatus Methanoperedens sp.]|nr:FlaD/FlaE family flagellar protein [Candidatus Methanoperedens sp.]
MIFNGKTIKSVANKFLGKFQKQKDETVEVKADAWKSMYPLFCNQALSAPSFAMESLKTLNVLVDRGIVGDYKDLQKVLLHENDEVAHLALDVLRKIQEFTIQTRIEGEKLARPESREENIGNVTQKKDREIRGLGQLPIEADIQNRVFNVIKIENFIADKLTDIEKRVEEQGKKISEMPASLTQDYDTKTRAIEENIQELRKLVDSKNVMAEKAVSEKLTDIEKKEEELGMKISKMPASLTQDYDTKTRAIEENIKELRELVDSKNIRAEDVVTEKLIDIEKKIEELGMKISEMPPNLTHDYDTKTRAIEENIKELREFVNSKNVMAEDVVTEKLIDIEKKIEELGMKISEMPPSLTQDYDNKTRAIEENIKELRKLVDSKNIMAEKAAGQVLNNIKPAEHVSMPKIPSISQFMQKTPEESLYGRKKIVRLSFLDNTPETFIILVNWIKFLMEKVGRNNLEDMLDYYVEIGWISEKVSSVMAKYAEGIDYYIEKPKSDILPDVHTKSLLFIEMLKARKNRANYHDHTHAISSMA